MKFWSIYPSPMLCTHLDKIANKMSNNCFVGFLLNFLINFNIWSSHGKVSTDCFDNVHMRTLSVLWDRKSRMPNSFKSIIKGPHHLFRETWEIDVQQVIGAINIKVQITIWAVGWLLQDEVRFTIWGLRFHWGRIPAMWLSKIETEGHRLGFNYRIPHEESPSNLP